MMAVETILLTGSTGHVGYAVLIEALSKGYKVVAAVRSEDKTRTVRSAPSVRPYLSQLKFIIVKDITQTGAFDEAVKGVDAVIHVASPITNGKQTDFEEELIKPAVQGTMNILESAKQQKSIRRLVITSSVAAVWNMGSDELFTAHTEVPEPTGPYDNAFVAYFASKNIAHHTVQRWIQKEQPHFNIVSIMPTFIIGKNELATTVEEIDAGSNSAMMGSILGRQNEAGFGANVVHIDDVAYMHVAALDPNLEGNVDLGASYDYKHGFVWDDALEIVKKEFPEAVAEGILPNNGHTGSVVAKYDASETEHILGFKYKDPTEMIKSIVGQYIEAAKLKK